MAKIYLSVAVVSITSMLYVVCIILFEDTKKIGRPILLNNFHHHLDQLLQGNESTRFKSLRDVSNVISGLSMEMVYLGKNHSGRSHLDVAISLKRDGLLLSEIIDRIEPHYGISFIGDRWFVYENPNFFDSGSELLIQMDDGTAGWVHRQFLNSLIEKR